MSPTLALALFALAAAPVTTATTTAAAPVTTATTTAAAPVTTATTTAAVDLAETSTLSYGEELLHGHRGWSKGALRGFFAATVDVGYLYLRPRAQLGWGRPHAAWFGVEANPIFSSTGLGGYAGVRGALSFVDLRLGARGYYAFERSYLAAAPSYDRLALSSTAGGHASYATLEAELTTSLPLGPGELVGLVSLSAIEGVPDGVYVYEETLHMIAKPPLVARLRGGYAWFPIEGRAHSVSPVFDVVSSPGRDTILIRAGLLLRVVLSPELEVRGTFVPTVWSKDAIGLLGGDFTELGLRWRWSTGR